MTVTGTATTTTAMGTDWDSSSSKTFITSPSTKDKDLAGPEDPCSKMEATAAAGRFWHVSQPGHTSKVKLFGIKPSSLLRSPVIKSEKVC